MTHALDGVALRAARYALRLQDPDIEADEIRDILAWSEASPDHEAELAAASRFLQVCDAAADQPHLRAQALKRARHVRLWRTAPRAAIAAGLLLLLAGGITLTLQQPGRRWWESAAPVRARYASGVNEQREVVLPDGSAVLLSGRSVVSISFTRSTRDVELAAGEALFTVRHDPERPFRVAAGGGFTTAVGTAFDVHRWADNTTVTVLHGVVRVSTAGLRRSATSLLGASSQVSYSTLGEIGRPQAVDVQTALAWRTGTLNFSSAPLAVIVSELNRYSTRPILIGSPEIAPLLVTGTVNTDAIEDWLRGVAQVKGLHITTGGDRIVLGRRQAGGGAAS